MIGVLANPSEERAVREFFELFKTPWEFYRAGKTYEVVLCATDEKIAGVAPKLLVAYSGKKTAFDAERQIQIHSQSQGATLSRGGSRLPLYGESSTFRHPCSAILVEENSGESVAYVERSDEGTFVRVGYDLFQEVQALLQKGQPPANAGIPTLELHIAFLRDLIVGCGLPLVEIPPAPEGYPLIGCLTHDVDHASLRRHIFDRTMFGFLYRALLGSVINVLRGRLPLRRLFTNWAAAAKLPFVYLGLAKDFWYEFDRYTEIEKGHPSTFFVIPFEGRPGRSVNGSAPGARASRYGASHIAEKMSRLKSAGCEIAVHGIDAWVDSSKGREEAREVTRSSESNNLGVRMHWLYWSEDSPAVLEEAGFLYDSTVGYTDAVGYRAGTGQVFQPLQVTRMLELPLHVMDTALFYPYRMNLSPQEAWERVAPILDNAVRMGGVVTVNWHDRSIAPERLWDEFYVEILQELEKRGAWFGTAAQVVSWFGKRRSVVFEMAQCESGALRIKASASADDDLPALQLRIHKPQSPGQLADFRENLPSNHVDIRWNGEIDTRVAL